MCAAVAAATAGSTLDFSRVHYVDHSASGNFLFRSNMPVLVNSTTNTSYFAYDALISYMKQRIATEAPAGTTFPAEFYLNIHSLDNIFEASDTQYEVAWAQANPTIGNVSFWPLLGQLVPPQWVNTSERDSLATNNTALWGVDELPQRMTSIRDMLEAQYDVPHVFLCKCNYCTQTSSRYLSSAPVAHPTLLPICVCLPAPCRPLRGRLRPHGRVLSRLLHDVPGHERHSCVCPGYGELRPCAQLLGHQRHCLVLPDAGDAAGRAGGRLPQPAHAPLSSSCGSVRVSVAHHVLFVCARLSVPAET